MGQYSAGPINRAVPSFRNSLMEYVKSDGRHSGHFSRLKNVHTSGVHAVLNNFDNF